MNYVNCISHHLHEYFQSVFPSLNSPCRTLKNSERSAKMTSLKLFWNFIQVFFFYKVTHSRVHSHFGAKFSPFLYSSTSLSSSKCSDAVRKSSSIEDKEQFVSSSTFKTLVSRWSCRSCTSSKPIKNLLISKMMQLVLFALFPLAHWTKQISGSQGH